MSKLQTEINQQLFTRLREGEASALDELFRRYYTDLCRVALRIVNNEQEAEEIIQELFVSIWEKRESQRDDLGSPEAYLRRAARNRSLNYLRDRKRIPVDDVEVPITIAAAEHADDALEQGELRDKIHGAIDALPERCRLVFVMSKIEDMSHKEIAGALDISPKTVENQMTRAYRYLRQWLGVVMLIIANVSLVI